MRRPHKCRRLRKGNMKIALEEICNWYNQLPSTTVLAGESALFDIDTIMGFVYTGPMANPLAVQRIPNIVSLYSNAVEKHVPIIRCSENHDKNCLEFNDFPPHCIKNTEEAKIIPELEKFEVDLVILKNSTNAFHEDAMKQWLLHHKHIKTIVFCGFVTDICIMQAAVSLKTFCNNTRKEMNVVICEPAVASYDLNTGNVHVNHNADLNHLMALRFMHHAGITISKNVTFK